MVEYKNIEMANGKPISTQGLCGIFAMSLVVNKSVQTVFNKYKKVKMYDDNWKGRTYATHYKYFLEKHYGRKVKVWIQRKDSYSEQIGRKMTLKKFIDEYTGRNRSYIISYYGHTMFIHNKVCYDQAGKYSYDEIGNRSSIELQSYWTGNTYKHYYGGQRNGIVTYAIEITNSLFKPSRVE